VGLLVYGRLKTGISSIVRTFRKRVTVLCFSFIHRFAIIVRLSINNSDWVSTKTASFVQCLCKVFEKWNRYENEWNI